MRRDIVTSLIAIVFFTLLLGIAYPLVITGVGQVAFPGNANGQKVYVNGKLVGSKSIGQSFRRPVIGKNGKPEEKEEEVVTEADPRYFQSRPSATEGGEYNAAASTFSNRGPNSTSTKEADEENLKAYLELEQPYDPGLTAAKVPVDAVNTSARTSTPTSRRPTRGSRRIASPPCAACRSRPLTACLEVHERAAGSASSRRTGRQRARAQPRPRPSESSLTMSAPAPTAPEAGARRRPARAPRDLAVPARHRRARADRQHQEARPARADPQPGDVRRRDRLRDHDLHLAQTGLRRQAARRRQRAGLVHVRDLAVAVADGDLRQHGRGLRRGPRPRAGRHAALDAQGDRRAARRRRHQARLRARPRRRRRGRGRRADPRRRHRDRGHRDGRRVGDHRRVGARDPRVRRRPQRGDGRHASHLRPRSSSRSRRNRASRSWTA